VTLSTITDWLRVHECIIKNVIRGGPLDILGGGGGGGGGSKNKIHARSWTRKKFLQALVERKKIRATS
jgi:hypothetical protein